MLDLRTNRLSLEKVVYSNGINVALHRQEESKIYQQFKRNLQRALYRQIYNIAKSKDRLEHLVFRAKVRKFNLQDVNWELIGEIAHQLGQDRLELLINVAAFLYHEGEEGGQAFLDKNGIHGVFGLSNPQVIAYFDDYSKLLINSVDEYTKKWVAAKIQEGKANLLTPSEIAQTLLEDGKVLSKLRAERITLTETAKAMTTVELEAARRYGIKEKIWRTSIDERVCPICLPLEGTQIQLQHVFLPGVAGPPGHVSCRCFIEEVIPRNLIPPDKIWLGE